MDYKSNINEINNVISLSKLGENVGIGTDNPLRKLDLIADLSTDAVRLKNTNSNGGGLSVFAANGGGGTNRILTLGDSSENIKVAVIENGNVGIGTTGPSATFVVQPSQTSFNLAGLTNGQIALGNNTSGGNAPTIGSRITSTGQAPLQFITGQPNTSTVPGMIFSVREDNNSDFATKADKPAFDFARFTTSLMRIDRDGWVGIGTTGPIGKLTVQGDDADIYLRSNDYTIARIINRGSSGQNLDTGLFSLMYSNTENVRIDAGGNSWFNGGYVGIGTTTPDEILETSKEVDGNQVGALLTNTRQAGTADSVSLNFGLGRAADGFIFNIPAIKFLKEQQWTGTDTTVDGALVFSTIQNETVSERARITSTGHLQVSTGYFELTSQPTTKLWLSTNQVQLYAGNLLVFGGYNASNDSVVIGNESGDVNVTLAGGANDKVLYLEGSSGNVGIGTKTPGAKLEVAGNVIIETTGVTDNLLLTSADASASSAPDIVMYRTAAIADSDTLGVLEYRGKNGMVPSSSTPLTYSALYSRIVDASANQSMLSINTNKGNGAGAFKQAVHIAAIGTNNSATGAILINPSSDFELPAYNLDVYGTASISSTLRVGSTVTATNFILSSDKTLKDNIRSIDNNHIDVNWKNFELKSEPGIKRSGVIAQELEEKHPEFVRTNKEGLKSVAYIDLLIAKIAELEARLEKAGI